MEKKQTAVEWLVDKLMKGEFINSPNELIEQAKEMEKEQIINAYDEGYDVRDDMGSLSTNPTGEDYYNETYNNNL